MGPHHVVGEMSIHPVEMEHACNSPNNTAAHNQHTCAIKFAEAYQRCFGCRGGEKEKKEEKKEKKKRKKKESCCVVATAINLQANTEHESTDCSDEDGDIEEAVYRLPAFLSPQQ